jgi:hypothetical protein
MGTAGRWFRQFAAGFRGRAAAPPGAGEAAQAGRSALLAAQRRLGDAMLAYLATQHFDTSALRIDYDAIADRFTLHGRVADSAARAQVLASCRRVLGAQRVHDALEGGEAGAGAAAVADPRA